jgi:AraC family transcriptional regulator
VAHGRWPAPQDKSDLQCLAFRATSCVGTDRPIEANGEQIKGGEIPGGRCAVLRVVGNTDNLKPAALYLYRGWLPASGEEARDFPIYCQRLSFFPEVPEHETVAELFLPLK